MRTFSKIYGLAGLRIGYGIGHPDFIAALEKIRQPFNINSVAQAGALAALDDTKHVEKTRKVNSRGLRLYARTFRKLKLEFIPSQANFILVHVGDGQRVFGELQKLGVIVRPMGGYHCRNGSASPSARRRKPTVPRGVENRAGAKLALFVIHALRGRGVIGERNESKWTASSKPPIITQKPKPLRSRQRRLSEITGCRRWIFFSMRT